MKRLILIDSHAIIHRAYHALPPLTTPSGEPINAVYGFTTILLRIVRELKPDYIAAAFDLPGPTFRHVAYERYKAQRPETPSDLASQFAKVREVVDVFDIARFEKEGYEADDVIGTIAKKLEKKKEIEVIVVTGDMDALQLVRPRLKVYSMRKGVSDIVVYDEAAVKERFGFPPERIVDFKGLKGDPSDNIPGVKGIGEKTAGELIRIFGAIEEIYKALKKADKRITPSVAAKLREGAEDAKFSRDLARMKTDVSISFSLEKLKWRDGKNRDVIKKLFERFGFFSLLKRFSEGEQKTAIQTPLLPEARKDARAPASVKECDGSTEGDAVLLLDGTRLFIISRAGGALCEAPGAFLAYPRAKKFFSRPEGFFVHDGKAILHFLRAHRVPDPRFLFDTLLAAYCVEPFSRDFSYRAVASRELGRPGVDRIEDDAVLFFQVLDLLKGKLAEGTIGDVFKKIEMPLISVLTDMEQRGIYLDAERLAKLAEKINAELGQLTKEIYADAAEEFNINSPQQLSRILFEKLGVNTHGLRKTAKGGVISTGAAELEKLKTAHPIVEKVLSYRELTKLKTTYVDTLPILIDKKTGRLHTTFNQTGTATGRLSSANPNLQNIPVMSAPGREIRKAFAAERGFLLASFDYSQIELRVVAHIAHDKKMIDAFRQELDIHKITAAEIYNVPIDKVTPDLRRAAKTLNFGVLYGMGAQAFAESTGLSQEEAKDFIREYFHDFSGVKNYIEETKRLVAERGYVETLFGRRRYIPEIRSPNWQLRREAERMAVNMPVQGSATGDIVKMAMARVDEWVRSKKLYEEVRMLLQVHDELLFEIKKEKIAQYAPHIKKIMESVAVLDVPLVVDVKVGANWGEQEAFDFL